ncbi:MAG: polysaccharide biosynthesis C-terminal domain-containing protein, partial [Solobacterium sp.]|nr:polysaccharide biosynthesis C-terminal domain-containing protein [Solobacterium sp.]
TGYTGAITSSVLTSLTIIYLDLAKLNNRFGATYQATGRRLIKILLACFCMNAVFVLFRLVGFTISESSRLIALVQLGIQGICGMAVYLYMTNLMKVPQAIFHKSLGEIARRLMQRG